MERWKERPGGRSFGLRGRGLGLTVCADSLTYLSLWQSWPDRCEHKVGQAQFEARQTVERDRQAALEKA